jgi:hypothetical protein
MGIFMSRLLTDNIWNEINRLSLASNKKHIAVAYVTDISKLHFKSNDVLVVDASDRTIMGGQTSAATLDDLFRTGVRLYSQEGLHAKVYVFDAGVVIGSTNASLSSRDRLIEAAVLCDEADIVQQAISYVSDLARKAIVIDRQFIEYVLQLPVEKQSDNTGPNNSGNKVIEETSTSLWRLKEPPPARSKNMRSYFLALIVSQLGGLIPGREFVLWKGNFLTHLQKGRMSCSYGGRYILEEEGVKYFSPDVVMKQELIEQFLHAITTGESGYLPDDLVNKELLPLTV